MKNKKEGMIEASWDLFFKTGDPFYFVAKNTFEKIEKRNDKVKMNNKENKEEDELVNI